MSKNLNQSAWEILFERYKIIKEIEKNGIFYISANQIKKEREPRLMAKFDHTTNLPPIFAQNKLSILPITRGDYAIAHFDAYHEFESDNDNEINQVSMPSYIQSIDSNNITSETIALNCATATGIITDFTEDFDIIPTVSGRMKSGNFNFNIKDVITNKSLNVGVQNSQIEIDAAYEGVNYLSLIEAKIDISDDFLIRQLYFPYRTWKNRIAKPVKPIFLVYSNGIYHLYEYKFTNPNEYSSLELVKQKNYSIEDTEITTDDIINVLNNTKIEKETDIPFPQADKFERVINLCELLNSGDYDHDMITQKYDFDGRQTNYYISAGRYLGLIENHKRGCPYELSNNGKAIQKLKYKQRQLSYCQKILSHEIFNKVIRLYFERGQIPEKNEIIKMMKSLGLHNINSDTTFFRRASTISSWVEWIVKLIQ